MKTYVSEDRCTLVRVSEDGVAEVATRPESDHVWGPPVRVIEERGYQAPQCECGHSQGQHRAVANGLRSQSGVCLIGLCPCRQFTGRAGA